MSERKINYQFKFLYAIGIIAVVAGHCGNGGISLGYEFFPPASFHLPLFMFASGYFYLSSDEVNLGKAICKKAKRLILPMYCYNLLYGLLVLLSRKWGFTIGEDLSLFRLLVSPWIDGQQFAYNMGAWFLAPLFMIYVFNLFLHKAIKGRFRDYVIEVVYIAAGVGAVWAARHGYNHGFFLALIRMGYFLPFYGLGILYKSKLESRDRLGSFPYFMVLLLIQLGVIFKYRHPVDYTYSWCNTFDNCYMPFIVPLLGILFWLRLARIVAPVISQNKYVMLVADNTYSIMINQFLGFMVVKLVFGLVNVISEGRIFMAFSWEEFRSDIWYYYVPGGISQWMILYLLAGIIFPILIQKGIDAVKSIFISRHGQRKEEDLQQLERAAG